MTTTIKIQGMHCASCKALIEDVCREMSGVKSCVVDMANNSAKIEHDPSLNLAMVKHEIEALGDYTVSIV